jgi:hypothetical protein
MIIDMLAEVVLFLHLLLAMFITLGLIAIPVGALLRWRWVRLRRLRLLHAGLMIFVALEAVLGITCPLTTVEHHLRGSDAPEFFLADLASSLLYWDLPLEFFVIGYLLAAAWVGFLWWKIPPYGANGANRPSAPGAPDA